MSKEVRVLFEEGSDYDLVVHLLRENEFEIESNTEAVDSSLLTIEDAHLVTEREREVLQALADYASTGVAARACYMQPSTLKTHEAHLRRKFRVHSRGQLIAAAFRRGLVR